MIDYVMILLIDNTMYMYVYIYIYIYTYIDVHKHIYIYIYTHIVGLFRSEDVRRRLHRRRELLGRKKGGHAELGLQAVSCG